MYMICFIRTYHPLVLMSVPFVTLGILEMLLFKEAGFDFGMPITS